jgi:hypothetical protein
MDDNKLNTEPCAVGGGSRSSSGTIHAHAWERDNLRPWEMTYAALAIALVSIVFSTGIATAFATGPQPFDKPAKLDALMRNVAWNELQARKHPAYGYEDRLKQEMPANTRTSLQIQTQQGLVSRLIDVDGKPPTEKECRGNLALLNRIAGSSALQESRLRSQQTDLRRRATLFAEMPAAFRFQYEGTEKDTGLLRIRYWPSPDFHPHSRVGGVLLGLQGTMWVDPSSQRIARIQGSLNKAVTFGWGILARLDRGGRFVMEQSRLPNGTWYESLLSVKFTGSILIFKRLSVNVTQIFSSYKPLSSDLTVAQAVGILKRFPVQCTGQ